MNCPVCDERMREVEKHGVRLDLCPGCKGVWLDRGELEKLMEVASSGGAQFEARRNDPEPTKAYDGHGDHDHERRENNSERGHGERKRKGSWIGEILGGFGGGDD